MENMDLVRVVGPMMVVLCLAVLGRWDYFVQLVNEAAKSKLALFEMSFMRLLLGLIVLVQFQDWSSPATGVVSFLGWLVMFKGVFGLFFPEEVRKSAHLVKDEKVLIQLLMGLGALIGIWMIIEGYAL